MGLFGNANKAGKGRRDSGGGLGRGRTIPGNTTPLTVHVNGPERIGSAMMRALAFAQATGSPMSNGNGGGITQNIGAGIVGRDSRVTGPLQNFNATANPLARPQSRNVGMQGGPGDSAGIPSMIAPSNSVAASLEWMGLPGTLGK